MPRLCCRKCLDGFRHFELDRHKPCQHGACLQIPDRYVIHFLI